MTSPVGIASLAILAFALFELIYYDMLHVIILYLIAPIYLSVSSFQILVINQENTSMLKLWASYGIFILLDTCLSFVARVLPFYQVFSLLRLVIIISVIVSQSNQETLYNLFKNLYMSSQSDIDNMTGTLLKISHDLLTNFTNLPEPIYEVKTKLMNYLSKFQLGTSQESQIKKLD